MTAETRRLAHPIPPAAGQALLEIKDLRVSANTPDGRVQILVGVNLHVAAGEAVGVVGESGSGKSTTARAIMGILPMPTVRVDSGQIRFDGGDLLNLSRTNFNRIRGRQLTMIPQDPNTSLNPVYTVGDQMEALFLWQGRTGLPFRTGRRRRGEARERVLDILAQVRLPEPRRIMESYPFQLSGGMRQRVLIAMALLNEPDLIVADEPGSALDVTVQDQILDFLGALLAERGLSLLFITHNLGIARRVTQRVAVMYAGQVVEMASTKTVFEEPLHPYTQGLVASVPKLMGGMVKGIPGRMADIANPPTGCRFNPRCAYRMDVCERVAPALVDVAPGHAVACHLYPAISSTGGETPGTGQAS
jgi:peptide/nickel transport system ATP-binding protein